MLSPFASIFVSGGIWLWVAAIAGAILIPLAWRAFRAPSGASKYARLALAFRLFGIALVLLCLLEPQWISPRAKRGANSFVLLGDNSQGLQIVETGATQSRGEGLKETLTQPSSTWYSKLAEDFQLRSYVFDRSLRRVSSFAELDFTGDRSALRQALIDLRSRFSGQPLAGVLLFTDGNAGDLTSGDLDVAGLPPIYPVVVGSANATRDLRFDRIDVRQTAFDDAPVSARARLSAHQLGAAEVAVSLTPLERVVPAAENTSGPVILDTRTQRLDASGAASELVFNWRPEGTGIQFFELVAHHRGDVGETGEATLLNNRRRIMVDRGKPRYRILYVSGRPNWEYKYISRALFEDPQLQMVGLIRVAKREPKFEFRGRPGEAANPLFRGFGRDEDETVRYDQPVLVRVSARDANELRGGFPLTAEELFAYDAVIIDDLEAAFFTRAQQELIRRFAAERGGGLLFLGGVDTLENGGYAGTPLAAALPIHLDRPPSSAPSGDARWSLTRDGWVEPWARVRSVETDERERLDKLPRFQVVNALGSIKPGASALATVEDEAGNSFPALVSHRFGSGRVAALPIGDLWRAGLRGDNEQADLARLWRQIARWLVTDSTDPVHLRAQPAADGERVSFRAVARDAAFKPLDSAQVMLTVTRVDAHPAPGTGTPFSVVTLPAQPSSDRPGEYVAELSLRDAGAYIAEIEVKDAAGKFIGRAQAGWVNDPAAEEFASLEPNVKLLEEIAAKSGGEVIKIADLDRLADRLPKLSAPIMEPRSWPIWHQSWVLLLVLACFIADWSLRRWRGLP